MRKDQIRVGGFYRARVNGNFVTVRVDGIQEHYFRSGRRYTYSVTNMSSGRKTTFRSAARFIREVPDPNAKGKTPASVRFKGGEEEDPMAPESDPTHAPGAGKNSMSAGVTTLSSGGEHSADPTHTSDLPDGVSPAGNQMEQFRSEDRNNTFCPRCGSTVTIANGHYDYHRHPQKGITCGMSGEKQTAQYHQCECREPERRPQGRQILCLRCGGEVGKEAEQRPDPTRTGVQSAAASTPARTSVLSNLRRVEDTAPHVIIQARAGTGKTTTLVSGLQVLMDETPTDARGNAITPSPQQKSVWDALAQSRGKVRTVGFVAFNRSIAAELKTRVPAGCDACTMHSLGLRAVTKSLGRLEISDSVVPDLIAELVGMDIYRLRKEQPVLLKATEQLVSLCKMNLTGTGYGNWDEDLSRLSAHYDVELENQKRAVFDLVPRVLDRCRDPKRQGRINYDDMIWLPVVLDLPVYRYDLLLVDEAQDLNRCQQALAKKAGKRLILCGDERQAIYGFAGADSESMPRMVRELGDTRKDTSALGRNPSFDAYRDSPNLPGCIILTLTVTRRCGKRIVKEAQRYVPDFSAHESNPDGEVREALYSRYKSMDGVGDRPWEQTYGPAVREGDMVLCRTNAPLVSECFRFLKRGIRANIQGRDIGQGLIALVKRLAKGTDGTVPGLITALSNWLAAEQTKERAKKTPSEAKLTSLQDRHDCIFCFTEGINSVEEVTRRIEDLFTDAKDRPGVRFSSVHKAKGLEAENVFILFPPDSGPRMDRMQPWERVQEDNIRYVAITRAIRVLTYVS